jgi:hypothetical protein
MIWRINSFPQDSENPGGQQVTSIIFLVDLIGRCALVLNNSIQG